jgi:hypothetical protein
MAMPYFARCCPACRIGRTNCVTFQVIKNPSWVGWARLSGAAPPRLPCSSRCGVIGKAVLIADCLPCRNVIRRALFLANLQQPERCAHLRP